MRVSNPVSRDLRAALLSGAVLLAAWAGFGAANEQRAARLRRLPPPEFSVPGGIHTNPVTLRLSAPFGTVRSTIDGSEPTEKSPVWAGEITLTNSTLVRARAFEAGLPPSATVSQAYTLAEPDLAGFTSNLPLIVITSFGQEIDNEAKRPVAMRVIGTGESRSALLGPADFDGRGLINVRGRASLRYPKRSYALRTIDDADNDLSVSLLGLPRESDWILYAPFPDKTLMRDVLAYELSNRMGQWAPRTVFAEVFVSQSGGHLSQRDYAGVYALVEKIKRDKHRVNIQKLTPEHTAEPEVTGGYIFKKDHVDRTIRMAPANDLGGFAQFGGSVSGDRRGFPTRPGGFPADPAGFLPPFQGRSRMSSSSGRSVRSRPVIVTNRLGVPLRRDVLVLNRELTEMDEEMEEDSIGSSDEERFKTTVTTNRFYYVEPEPDEITPLQRAWLQRHVNDFENALYGPDFRDATRGYAPYIDTAAWIDHHILVEVTKNVDGFRFSTFFHKDRGGKIKMGPLWDWNLSFGNANGKQGWLPEHWLWPQLDDKEYSYFRRLFEDPDFGQAYVDRWGELRTNVLATSNVLARVDELAKLLGEAQARNFERWPILGRNVNPNWFVGASYDEEVQWMKNFIQTRLAWIEKQFLAAPEVSPGDAVRDGQKVSLSAAAGKIYFTLDSTDPRAPGGSVSPKAQPYSAPVVLAPSAQLFARAQHENRWSPPAIVRLTH